MVAIFRGVIESVKQHNDTSQKGALELIMSVFLITVDGKIQVIDRNPIRFFTSAENLISRHDYNVGDMAKITVCPTNDELDVEDISCYAADKPRNKLSSSAMSGMVVSFRDVLKTSHSYETKPKKHQ